MLQIRGSFMNHNDVKHILANSTKDEWITDDESGSFTYKKDLNLRIEGADDETFREFNEPWAVAHSDPNAKAVDYVVKYGSSFVEKRVLVSVDGYRATLPMPKSANDLRVIKSDVNFAKILDMGGRVEEYLSRTKIQVIDDE